MLFANVVSLAEEKGLILERTTDRNYPYTIYCNTTNVQADCKTLNEVWHTIDGWIFETVDCEEDWIAFLEEQDEGVGGSCSNM